MKKSSCRVKNRQHKGRVHILTFDCISSIMVIIEDVPFVYVRSFSLELGPHVRGIPEYTIMIK